VDDTEQILGELLVGLNVVVGVVEDYEFGPL
jgi:hypothetical protein